MICFKPPKVSHLPSMNRHLIVVKGFACPRDPRSHGVWASLPLAGSPMTTWSSVKGQTKCGSRRPACLEKRSSGPSTQTQVREGRFFYQQGGCVFGLVWFCWLWLGERKMCSCQLMCLVVEFPGFPDEVLMWPVGGRRGCDVVYYCNLVEMEGGV